MFGQYLRHFPSLIIAIALFLNHLLRLSKPSSIGTTLEYKRKSLCREYDRTMSPDKECLSLMQGGLFAILVLHVEFAWQ
jgi:hypothetical protein